MVEFKLDFETRQWVMLEVNPRFWGSLPLALASGADFPLALFQLLVEGRTQVPDRYRVGLSARNVRADAKWHLTNLRADRSDPTVNTKPWPDVARETCRSLLTASERSDTFTFDDPAPAFAEGREMACNIGRHARLLGAWTLARVSRGYRRRMRAAARADLRRAACVLFVCKGNIGRSPFAAAIAERSLRSDQHVLSAGFLEAGRRSPADAVTAAREWQVDLTTHRSSVVSSDLVGQSGAIFVFDLSNYTRMLTLFPDATDRLHLIGALADEGPLFVPDPWGRGFDVYAAGYRRIAEALREAVAPLSSERGFNLPWTSLPGRGGAR
jgi:protein-tyrosine-phosphatase